jgi:DivIVA domain-containing protein
MAIAPDEIEAKEFSVAVRGYDKDEVRSYLSSLASTLRESGAPDPDTIADREFLAAVRGYDKDEVRAYLRDVAAELRDGAGVVQPAAATAPAEADSDPFDTLGAEVAAILRSAKEGAEARRQAAERDAEQIRAAAERDAKRMVDEARSELERAEQIRSDAEQQAKQIRATAEQQGSARIREAEGEVRKLEERAAARLAELRQRERDLADRLSAAESLIAAMREELTGTDLLSGLDLRISDGAAAEESASSTAS